MIKFHKVRYQVLRWLRRNPNATTSIILKGENGKRMLYEHEREFKESGRNILFKKTNLRQNVNNKVFYTDNDDLDTTHYKIFVFDK